jgi:hypothetical protein
VIKNPIRFHLAISFSGKGNKSMSRKLLYLILGSYWLHPSLLLPDSFLMTHGLAARVFLNQLFGTPISTFFAVDLLISCGLHDIPEARGRTSRNEVSMDLLDVAVDGRTVFCSAAIFCGLVKVILNPGALIRIKV